MNDSHQKAAEFHDLAAYAHRTAMEHQGRGEHLTGHEYSKRALEHSTKAFELGREPHRESEKRAPNGAIGVIQYSASGA